MSREKNEKANHAAHARLLVLSDTARASVALAASAR
jgi:hypothetical protein